MSTKSLVSIVTYLCHRPRNCVTILPEVIFFVIGIKFSQTVREIHKTDAYRTC